MGRKTEHHLLGSSQTSPACPFGTKIKIHKDVRMVTSVLRNWVREFLISYLC